MVRTTTAYLIATLALFVSVTVPMPVADPLLKVRAAPDSDASFVYMMPRAQKGGKSSTAAPETGSAEAGGTPEGGSAPAAPVERRAQKGGKSSTAALPGTGSSAVAGGTPDAGSAPAAPEEG